MRRLFFALVSFFLTSLALATEPTAPVTPVSPQRLMEVLPAAEYLELSPLDRDIEDAIQFEKSSGKLLYLPPDGAPYLILSGALKDDVELSLNHHWLKTPGGRFVVKIPLLLEPGILTLRIFHPGKPQFEAFRLVYYWLKFPPSLRIRVREGTKVTEAEAGYHIRFRHEAFTQLYSGGSPITVVDLDATRHADLTFRIYYPPEAESSYDGWRLIIRDARGKTVGRFSRYGMPPHFVDWRRATGRLWSPGNYTYQINLYRNGETIAGPKNTFQAIEGGSLLPHDYLPAIQCEPREEVGYFKFSGEGQKYSNVYVGGSLPFVFWNHWLVRGDFLTSLYSIDPNSSFTFTRLGAGFRVSGQGDSPLLGHPFLYQLDILLGSSSYTLFPSATLKRYAIMSILVEPRLLIWSGEQLVPWFEYGTRPTLDQQRLSVGIRYEWLIRPWSLKFGMGVGFDSVFFPGTPQLDFTVLRTVTSLAFIL